MVANVHVDFAAHTELPGQIDAELDRKARARQEMTFIPRFEVVDVCTIAMHVLADRMAGAVDEIFTIAGLANRFPGEFIDFPAADGPFCMDSILDKLNR